jgi:hypothetical protein
MQSGRVLMRGNRNTEMNERLAYDLRHRGYIVFSATEWGADPTFALHARELAAHFSDISTDPSDATGYRKRGFMQCLLFPWRRTLARVPDRIEQETGAIYASYFGHPAYHCGQTVPEKRMSPLVLDDAAYQVLEEVIWRDFDLIASKLVTVTYPILSGIHVIAMTTAASSTGARSSNDCLHTDGEPFTFGHLLERVAVIGAENVIARRECDGQRPEGLSETDVLARFTLSEPFAGFAVNDQLVSHYVSPVHSAPGTRSGRRTILLIDFAPLVPGTFA